MRRYVIAIIAAVSLALSGGQAYAQRCLPGMKGLELRGGLVGGSSGDFYLGTAMSVYSGRANRWVFGAEYLQKSYRYKDMSIPRAQFTAEGGILPELPFGCLQDILPVDSRFGSCRI